MSPEIFARYLARETRQFGLRRAAVAHRVRSLKDKHDAEAAEEACWSRELQLLESVSALGEVVTLTVPSGPRLDSRVTAERRDVHVAHLQSIIAEACLASPQMQSPVQADDPVDEGDTDSLAGRLCGLCAGGCCTNGDDTAYLTAGTIRRVLRRDAGETDADSLLARYLGFLPDEAMQGSCIYHTRNGCSLPRDWRSDVCNRYRCDALKTLSERHDAKTENAGSTVLVLQRAQDLWRGQEPGFRNEIVQAVLLCDDGLVPLPAPACMA